MTFALLNVNTVGTDQKCPGRGLMVLSYKHIHLAKTITGTRSNDDSLLMQNVNNLSSNINTKNSFNYISL